MNKLKACADTPQFKYSVDFYFRFLSSQCEIGLADGGWRCVFINNKFKINLLFLMVYYELISPPLVLYLE